MGLFDEENSVEQKMFELAVQKVNIDPNFSNVFLKAKIEIVDSSDTYKTGLKGTYYTYTHSLHSMYRKGIGNSKDSLWVF